MGIACSSISAHHTATSQATAPTCTPAKANAPYSRHLHPRAYQPLELSSEVQETGDICLKQTSFPGRGDVCLNTASQFPSLQSSIVNLKPTQTHALHVTPNSCSPPEILPFFANTTSKGILSLATCFNHSPRVSVPAFSVANAVIWGNRELLAQHTSSS